MGVKRIFSGYRPGFIDPFGEKVRTRAKKYLGIDTGRIWVVKAYYIEKDLSPEVLEEIAERLFLDRVSGVVSVERPIDVYPYSWAIEVTYRPGVTDNEAKVAKESISFYLVDAFEVGNVYSSLHYLIERALGREEVVRIAEELVVNSLIHHYTVLERKEYLEEGRSFYVPFVRGSSSFEVMEFDLSSMEDEELLSLSDERLLALSLEEMKAIKAYLEREDVKAERVSIGLSHRITDVELEAIAQTWSEHCKHKIFNARIRYRDGDKEELVDGLFPTFIKAATDELKRPFCVSVFKDNAGVIRINEKWLFVFKVETHNAPSALDPYGGALTGIVGVNRDPFGTGKGAKLIFNTDVFCFASPFYDGELPPRVLHPRRIFEGVREGVEHGGNKSGIPTVNGSIVFDESYLGRPLVYCGTGGIMPSTIAGKPSHEKKANPGDLAVMVGGRVGKDGIHGATFSSRELDEASPISAVQIGDPITQKKMFDFLLLARDRGLYNSITDNGAGGLSSSIGEMAKESGGCEIYLDKVPLKYEGLSPWEILLSESQERMTVAVPPDKLDEFMELSKKMDVESTVVGRFTDSGKFHVFYGDRTVAYLDMDFFHEGLPRMELQAVWVPRKEKDVLPHSPEDYGGFLRKILGRLNVCSKELVVRQYDHEVQGTSVVKPLMGVSCDGPSDAAVLMPFEESTEGIVVSHGICPKFSRFDTYHMARVAFDEAVRNNVATGGDISHMAALDNFSWCDPIKSPKNPDGDFKLAQLVRACRGLYEMAKSYGVPFISGKDSMKNDYVHGNLRISILPTVLVSVVSRIPDVSLSVTIDVKSPGDPIYILGLTRDEMAGSEYFEELGIRDGKVPKVDDRVSFAIYTKLRDAIYSGLVVASHDVSDGGLAVTLSEMAFSGGLGLEVELSKVPYEGQPRDDFVLFSESPGRIVVEVEKGKEKEFEDMFSGLPVSRVGTVLDNPYLRAFGLSGDILLEEDIFSLKDAWQDTLRFV